MSVNPIGVAVPFFFALMLVELFVSRARGREVYRVNDGLADLACGMGDQMIGVFFKFVALGIYTWFFDRFALFDLDMSSPWTWVIGMVGVDLFYYAYHRFSHRVNWAWATHAVHHQSEEYNLAVALRQPWFSQFYSWAFYIPLAVLGVHPVVWATSFAFNLLYQFWIHTRLMGKLGWFEWVFNTPSHHRVHHGTNPAYIDKNYGGILIVWDRLFGTFAVEEEEPLYGTLKPLRSWSPVWANVGPFVMIAQSAAEVPGLWNKLKVWWMPPGWQPGGVVEPPFPAQGRGYDASGPQGLRVYTVLHLLPISALMAIVLSFERALPLEMFYGSIGVIVWTSLMWSGLYEGRRWAVPLELTRLLVVPVFVAVLCAQQGGLYPLLAVFVGGLAACSVFWVWRQRAALGTA